MRHGFGIREEFAYFLEMPCSGYVLQEDVGTDRPTMILDYAKEFGAVKLNQHD